jgi:hypothetical protein
VRTRDGKRLKMLFATAINAPAQKIIRMNDLVVQSGIVVPIVLRAKAAAMSTRIRGMEHNVYEVDFWNLAMWSKET